MHDIVIRCVIDETQVLWKTVTKLLKQVDSKDVRMSLASDGLLARERLSNLKNKIRMSSIPVKENYSDPEEVAALILADLSDQIAVDFPKDCTSEHASLSDAMIAEEYEKSVLKSFFGRETEMNFVDERILGIQTYPLPLIVCGKYYSLPVFNFDPILNCANAAKFCTKLSRTDSLLLQEMSVSGKRLSWSPGANDSSCKTLLTCFSNTTLI
jgi:hypothetical protein